MTGSHPPSLRGIHHIKIAVCDLDRSLDFYERMLGASRIPEADHRHEAGGDLYAYILKVPCLDALLELRLDPDQAQKQRGFNFITFAVHDRAALSAWAAYLDSQGIPHSPVITAIQSWLIVVEDPDQHRLRLYSLEKHGPALKPDETNAWLGSSRSDSLIFTPNGGGSTWT